MKTLSKGKRGKNLGVINIADNIFYTYEPRPSFRGTLRAYNMFM